MKYLFAAVLSLSSGVAFAQQCADGRTSVAMSNFPVQDQDGLGTCYANAMGVVIQGSLGLSAPISYQHLAIAHASHVSSASTPLINPDSNDLYPYVGEGGWACPTFEAAKAYGFCPASEFPLDVHGGGDGASVQEDVIQEVGRSIDQLAGASAAWSDENWRNFTSNLAMRFQQRDELCKLPEAQWLRVQWAAFLPEFINARVAASEDLLATQIRNMENSTGENRQNYLTNIVPTAQRRLDTWKEVRSTMFTAQPVAPDGTRWVANDLLLNKMVSNSAAWRTAVAGVSADTPASSAALPYSTVTPQSDILSLASKEFVRLGRPGLTPATINSMVMNVADDIFSVARLLGSRANCTATFDRDMLTRLSPGLAQNACAAYAGDVTPEMNPFLQQATAVVDRLRQSQFASLPGRGQALLQVLAPRCAETAPVRRAELAGWSCESFNPSGMTEPKAEILQKGRSWIVERLCSNRPLSISVCTEFMRTEASAADYAARMDTQFCKVRPDDPTKVMHGNHAMAVVGYKTENGRLRLHIQNSWGTSCGVTDALSKGITCEPSGRFWVDADVMLNNTLDISGLTR